MCHISRGMKTISFQHVMSAPKTCPIVYKTCIILRASLRNPAIEWRQSAMNLITPVNRERARAYYSVGHRICKFIISLFFVFSNWQSRTSLAPTWITILLYLRLALASPFKFTKMSGTLAPGKQWTMVAGVSFFTFCTIESPITRILSSGFSVGASLSGLNLFDLLKERCFDPPHSHPVALLQGLYRNRTMYRTPWASRIQSHIYSPHILT